MASIKVTPPILLLRAKGWRFYYKGVQGLGYDPDPVPDPAKSYVFCFRFSETLTHSYVIALWVVIFVILHDS